MQTVECCCVPRIQSAYNATRLRPNIECEQEHLLTTVQFKGKPSTAIVDTGASQSFIREDLATIMGAEGRPQEAEEHPSNIVTLCIERG